ncbi:UNVERIFIED_ORG: hypothetical protein ABIC54_005183 [Burkholderia sp. 1263]
MAGDRRVFQTRVCVLIELVVRIRRQMRFQAAGGEILNEKAGAGTSGAGDNYVVAHI